MKYDWGTDPNKWLIKKWGKFWFVFPPVGSFWGEYAAPKTYEEALASFREQTATVGRVA